MSDIMRPPSFEALLDWISGEYATTEAIFGIPEIAFFPKRSPRQADLFGHPCSMPLGPAAGPHTQLAANILAAYLCGGRFIELKTVQKMDTLEIPKPCIDAEAEGYNTEWSTELTVGAALDEYVKAWLLTHTLQELLFPEEPGRGFVFNMSVGYDLEGIRTPKMDAFIETLIDASAHPAFTAGVESLRRAVDGGQFDCFHTDVSGLRQLLANPPAAICTSVSLSTMHGCPPADIEAICRYLLAEKGLDVYVKLNPTLLGHDFVRDTLHSLGYGHIELREDSFRHDLQYPDALAMLERLKDFAGGLKRRFGVKLSNTLATVNNRGILPGEEMYMSGRALFPLTATLAARLAEHFRGRLDISFSGGATVGNVGELFACGVRPVTVATDLLKPGGYRRLAQMARKMEEAPAEAWERPGLDVEGLLALSRRAVEPSVLHRGKSSRSGLKELRPLPVFDCVQAPCVANCPIGQDVPGYAHAIANGDFEAARLCIARQNPLPRITGTVCDHQCMAACSRNDYDEPVRIRDLKLAAAHRAEYAPPRPAREADAPRIAVVGAGPAGLAAAWFLARGGAAVTVLDREAEPGGTVRHVIPRFRIAPEEIALDADSVRALGVEFRLPPDGDLTAITLREEGFDAVFLAVGAGLSGELRLEGDPGRVSAAVPFLRTFNTNPESLRLGRAVAVVGGGNSAMDAARAATKVAGVERVSIVYRRTAAQMPADREEYDNALADGVAFRDLLAPISIENGILKCQRMALGEPGPDGRATVAPVPGETVDVPADHVIAAVGERVDGAFLRAFGIPPDTAGRFAVDPATMETSLPDVYLGGDARRGPSTVVECLADGRAAAEAILQRFGLSLPEAEETPAERAREARAAHADARKGTVELSALGEGDGAEGLRREANRCLQCDVVCSRCVEVCPNRANVALNVPAEGTAFANLRQIVHLDDLCNACGNCATFCPWQGRPYEDKFTLFREAAEFEGSRSPGVIRQGDSLRIRADGEVFAVPLSGEVPARMGGGKRQAVVLARRLCAAAGYLPGAGR